MTKLQELKAARVAAWATYDATHAAARDAAWAAYIAADTAYQAELKKTQKEQTID